MTAGPSRCLPTVLEDEDAATPSLAARLHVTLGHPPRRFATGEVAPAGLHWCLAPEAGPTADLGPDGLARSGLIPELDLPRRMWAGADIEAPHPVRIGDRVIRRSQVAAPVRKTGRSGPLAFCAISHEYLVGSRVALRETQTIVYREAATAGQTDVAPSGARGGVLKRVVEVDGAQLFRFSALTFNAHRIHLDQDFARRVEGHGDILVHGTLTAALLLNASFDVLHPCRPWRAAIRALAPAPPGPIEIRTTEHPSRVVAEAFSGSVRVMTATVESDGATGGCGG